MKTCVLLFIVFACVNCELCSWKENIDNVVKCATTRALRTLQFAEQQENFEVLPGIVLKRNVSHARSSKKLHFNLSLLPTLNETSEAFDMLISAGSDFLSSRFLQIKLPLGFSKDVARSFEEGRAKMKKTMGSFILGLGTRMMSMVPIMFGGLALLTAKALVVGKLAFVISVILFIQIFFSGRSYIPSGGTYGIGIPPTYGVPTYGGPSTNNWGTNSIGGGWGTSGQYPNARSINISDEENSEQNSED